MTSVPRAWHDRALSENPGEKRRFLGDFRWQSRAATANEKFDYDDYKIKSVSRRHVRNRIDVGFVEE